MASFVAQGETVTSQQGIQFKTYPSLFGSAVAQLWQLPTQLPSTNPTPRCQISSIPMDQIWMLENAIGCLQLRNRDLQHYNVQVSFWLQTKDTEGPHRKSNREALHIRFSQQQDISFQAAADHALPVSNLQHTGCSVRPFLKKGKKSSVLQQDAQDRWQLVKLACSR